MNCQPHGISCRVPWLIVWIFKMPCTFWISYNLKSPHVAFCFAEGGSKDLKMQLEFVIWCGGSMSGQANFFERKSSLHMFA